VCSGASARAAAAQVQICTFMVGRIAYRSLTILSAKRRSR
jgi:hypothetical protein